MMNKVTADTAIKLVAANNYISYNKFIAKKFGLEATIVFGELCSVSNIYNDKEFYCLKEQIEEDTCLSEDAVRKSLRFLSLCGAITITKKGIPCKNYYTINIDEVCKILNDDNWVKPIDETEERKKQKRKEKKSKNEQTSNSSSDSEINISSDSEINTTRDADSNTSSDSEINTTFKKTIRETINLNYNSISSETKVSSEIPFPEPEDVEPKKIKRTRTTSKKTTDENSVSFSKESYTEVMDLYYDTRLSLNNQMTVTDEVYKRNLYTPLLKKYFELYGVEKCKLAIKNASTNEWVRNKTDFGLRTIFNDKMITKFLEDTSVVTNRALRHDMFFNDPKHSHIDYENQDYTEEF